QQLAAQGPEELFRHRPKLDCQVTQIEKVQRLVHGLDSVVIALQEILLGKIAINRKQVVEGLGGVRGNLRRRLIAVEVRNSQDVEDQHAMIRDQGPARFRN